MYVYIQSKTSQAREDTEGTERYKVRELGIHCNALQPVSQSSQSTGRAANARRWRER